MGRGLARGSARVGVVGGLDVSSPVASSPPASRLTLADAKEAPATYAALWAVVALIMLYFIL